MREVAAERAPGAREKEVAAEGEMARQRGEEARKEAAGMAGSSEEGYLVAVGRGWAAGTVVAVMVAGARVMAAAGWEGAVRAAARELATAGWAMSRAAGGRAAAAMAAEVMAMAAVVMARAAAAMAAAARAVAARAMAAVAMAAGAARAAVAEKVASAMAAAKHEGRSRCSRCRDCSPKTPPQVRHRCTHHLRRSRKSPCRPVMEARAAAMEAVAKGGLMAVATAAAEGVPGKLRRR